MAMGTAVVSAKLDLDGDFEFFTNGTDVIAKQLTPRERLPVSFSYEIAGTTDDIEGYAFGCIKDPDHSGETADAGAAGSIDLQTTGAGAKAADYFNGCIIVITGGTGEGQARLITDFETATNDRATVDHNWNTTPDNTSTYDIYRIVSRLPAHVDVSVATATPTWDDPSSRGVICTAEGGEWWLFAAKGGTTDAHDAWIAYQEDNVAA